MRIQLFGAAGEVTGSCYLIESARARVLLDFGLHQGGKQEAERNRRMPPIDAGRLDAVLLTHAHIDHLGRMPLLARERFKGPIFATQPTVDLAGVMLRDSAHLQEMDARRLTMKRQRRGLPGVQPLYTLEDAERVVSLFRSVEMSRPVEVAAGVSVRWVDSGHILGSASIEVTVDEPGGTRVIAFSGDLGPRGVPLMNDFTTLPNADLVFLESTYGDRDHRCLADTCGELESVIKQAIWSKEKVIIPAFALGRTQQLVFQMGKLQASGRLPQFPVFVDSPMAVEASRLYTRYAQDLDGDAQATFGKNSAARQPWLHFTATSEESRAINALDGAAVIIAASGMCTGGRILHHLKHNLWRRDAHVIIAGYQSAGSLGRQLVDGAQFVRVLGERLIVRAKIHTLGGFSAHAGQTDLLAWHAAFKGGGPAGGWPRVALIHGEDKPRAALAEKVKAVSGKTPVLPAFGELIDL